MQHLPNYLKLLTAKPESLPHTRSFVFTKTWSRHYRFADFCIDLAFSGNRFGAVLQGNYYRRRNGVVKDASLVLMHSSNDLIMSELLFERDGPFRFTLKEKGDYELIAESGEDVYEVDIIRVS